MRRLPKIFWVGFGILVGLALAEIGLRLFFWAAEQRFFGLSPQRTTIRWQDDPTLGRRFVSNQAGWFVTPSHEYFTWVEVNRQGWRDSEHSFEKPQDTYRILLIGDSFIENLQVRLEQTFFKQIERDLAGKLVGKKIETLAMGVGDSGTAQQYLVLENYGLQYQPDLVVQLFFTGNDVKNNSPALMADPHRPYFKLVDGKLALLPFTPRSEIPKYHFASLVKNNLRIVELLLDLKGKLLTPRSTDYPVDYHIYDESYNPEYEQAWEVTRALIKQTKVKAEENGAKYLLVSLANNEQVNPEVWQELRKKYPALAQAKVDLVKPDKVLAEFCQKEEIDCLFLLSPFREFLAQNPKSPTHYKLDGHWTPAGANLVAQILSERLKDYFSIK